MKQRIAQQDTHRSEGESGRIRRDLSPARERMRRLCRQRPILVAHGAV